MGKCGLQALAQGKVVFTSVIMVVVFMCLDFFLDCGHSGSMGPFISGTAPEIDNLFQCCGSHIYITVLSCGI